jgi:hypothetical protein
MNVIVNLSRPKYDERQVEIHPPTEYFLTLMPAMNIPVKETTLSGRLVPTNPDRGSNGSGTELKK